MRVNLFKHITNTDMITGEVGFLYFIVVSDATKHTNGIP